MEKFLFRYLIFEVETEKLLTVKTEILKKSEIPLDDDGNIKVTILEIDFALKMRNPDTYAKMIDFVRLKL